MQTLFVEADEPLLIFPSIDAAEQYLEATDVRAGVYPRAYGPMGELYEVTVSGERVAVLRSDADPRPDDLAALILDYLQAVGEPTPRC